jgi:hypothetical protein
MRRRKPFPIHLATLTEIAYANAPRSAVCTMPVRAGNEHSVAYVCWGTYLRLSHVAVMGTLGAI